MPAIGIDLGTTNSCVAVCRGGTVDIIANDQGARTTPSYVAFNESERLIGAAAKNQASMNPENTIYDAKRLIGRDFNDESVQADSKHFSFKIVDQNKKPAIQVTYKGEEKQFRPEEISAMVLTKMKQTAEDFLGEKVTDAVITVPAYFNDSQRQSTKDAGAIAGINVLRIINEPTAAAIAYGLNENENKDKTVLIVDVGGGTADFSLLNIDEGVFEVLATAGDTHLGGEDLDNRMVDYFANEFKKKHKKEMKDNSRSLRRLRTACENAKKTLSTSSKAIVEIDSLYDGLDLNASITRARFEDLCGDFLRKMIPPIDKVLKDAKVGKSDVDEVVLVGGTTRIPKLQQMVSEYFNGKVLCKSVNPDECVAYGAAVQAALLSGDTGGADILLLDVAPLSLGIETSGSMMTALIPRNSTIPSSKSKTFSTFADGQTAIDVNIYEGERALTKDNNKLGNFRLGGIAPAKRGVPQLEITFDLDANGILNVTAVDKGSGKENKIVITNDAGRLSKEDIERMVSDAENYAEEDALLREKISVKNDFENYLFNMKSGCDNEKISEEDKTKALEIIETNMTWLNDNGETCSVGELKEKRTSVDSELNTLLSKHFDNGDVSGDVPETQEYTGGPTVEEVD